MTETPATFESLGLDPKILQALGRIGFERPSPIQAEAIPIVLSGRDVIGLAETGSGKTAACAIPICERVRPSDAWVQALILVPTRELALQYAVETQRIGLEKGVKAYALYGGEDMSLQTAKLKAGVQVLIATPGRLIDLIYQRLIDLSQVETLILDEADEMLSMGFIEDIEFIIQCLIHPHQTLLFSATMPAQVKALAHHHLKDPAEVHLTKSQTAPPKITHQFVYCRHISEKTVKLIDLIKDLRPKQSLIFCQSRRLTEELKKHLGAKISDVDYLHGGLSQDLRTSLTQRFRTGKIRHMVATDVAARGLDFSGVTHVFIYNLSEDPETYVHRSGRTGRSGRSGTAITFVADRDLHTLSRVLHMIRKEPEWIGIPPRKFRGESTHVSAEEPGQEEGVPAPTAEGQPPRDRVREREPRAPRSGERPPRGNRPPRQERPERKQQEMPQPREGGSIQLVGTPPPISKNPPAKGESEPKEARRPEEKLSEKREQSPVAGGGPILPPPPKLIRPSEDKAE